MIRVAFQLNQSYNIPNHYLYLQIMTTERGCESLKNQVFEATVNIFDTPVTITVDPEDLRGDLVAEARKQSVAEVEIAKVAGRTKFFLFDDASRAPGYLLGENPGRPENFGSKLTRSFRSRSLGR